MRMSVFSQACAAAIGLLLLASPAWAYKAYIPSLNTDSVLVLDTNTNQIIRTLGSGGSGPINAAVTPDERSVFVTNFRSNSVSIIDTASDSVAASAIAVGTRPYGVVISPDGRNLYVSNSGDGTVSVIDALARRVITTIAVGANPLGLAITPDGNTIYVNNRDGNSVSVISRATHAVTATIQGVANPWSIAITPDGKTAYVTNDDVAARTVFVIDTATNTVSPSSLSVGLNPVAIAIRPDGRAAYVTNTRDNTVSVINLTTNTVSPTVIPVGSTAFTAAVTPDGKSVYIANVSDRTLSVIDTATNVVGSTIPNAPGGYGMVFVTFTAPGGNASNSDGGAISGGALGPWIGLLLLPVFWRRRLRSLLFAAALASVAAGAQASDTYGAAMGSVVKRDSGLGAKTGFGGQFLIGAPWRSGLNWEANLYASRNDGMNGAGSTVSLGNFGGGADLRLPVLSGENVQPFLLAGLGMERADYADLGGGTENSPFADLGFGALFPLATGTGTKLRSELRAYLIHYRQFPGGSPALDFRFNLGLGFGGTASAPKPEPIPAAALAAAEPVPAPPAPVAPSAPAVAPVAITPPRCTQAPEGLPLDAQGCVDWARLRLGGVAFRENSARLRSAALPVLDAAAQSLQRNPGLKLEIAGYTDSRNRLGRNQQLSQERAEAVMDYLVGKGIAAGRLSARGYGDLNPVDSNATESGRANNRRVEFKVQ